MEKSWFQHWGKQDMQPSCQCNKKNTVCISVFSVAPLIAHWSLYLKDCRRVIWQHKLSKTIAVLGKISNTHHADVVLCHSIFSAGLLCSDLSWNTCSSSSFFAWFLCMSLMLVSFSLFPLSENTALTVTLESLTDVFLILNYSHSVSSQRSPLSISLWHCHWVPWNILLLKVCTVSSFVFFYLTLCNFVLE